MRLCLNEKGLTLVEVIVAATLLTIVVCGALLLYEQGVRSWVWTEQQTDVVDNLRIALDKIVYDLREASDISVPGEGEENVEVLTFFYPPDSTDVTYDVQDKKLRRNDQPVTTPVITAVYFSRNASNPALVKIELIGKADKVGVKTGEVSVRTAVYARSL
jgi:Tfp pilus assembly protein PilW